MGTRSVKCGRKRATLQVGGNVFQCVPWKLGENALPEMWLEACSVEVGWKRVPWKLGGNAFREMWVEASYVEIVWERVQWKWG